MLTFTEAQLLDWFLPVFWPFLRTLSLLSAAPVLSMRSVPVRVKIGLALLTALAAQASLPALPRVPLDSVTAFAMVAQQVVIGATIGFAARTVFAAMEFTGELVGLQMGLNFAGFFDPASGSQGTATSRFLGTMGMWLFVVINGHLLLILSVVESFASFPVSDHPLEIFAVLKPQTWGADVFRLGLWLALPIVTMLLFVNLVLGVVSRVAQQLQVFSIGFPITVGLGLLGLTLTLPALESPMTAALERMLSQFR